MISPGGQNEMHARPPESVYESDRLITGSVRDPWDWYVSLWGYGCDGKGVLHNKLTEEKKLREYGFSKSFREGISNLYNNLKRNRKFWIKVYSDSNSPKLFRMWLNAVLDSPKRSDSRGKYNRSSLSKFAGLYTFRYCYLFHDTDAHLFDGSINDMKALSEEDSKHNIVDHVIRMENISEGIIKMLRDSGTSVESGFYDTIRSMGRTNPSSRRNDFSFYYDNATRDLVGRRDALIVEKYGYEPVEIREL
jgi:hypothetical protein